MTALEGGDDSGDMGIVQHHFHLPFSDLLQAPDLAQKGTGTRPWAELALPQRLPAAVVVIPDAPRTGGENRLFYLVQMALRNIEAKLVQRS